MFCALCGANNSNDGRFCNKCGAALQGQKNMPPPGAGYGAPEQPYTGPTETSGKAIGSLICGLLFFIFPIALLAIVLGHLSLSDIRKAAGRITGRGMAVAGLALGYTGVAIIPVMIIAAIAIPNLLRARMAANEAAAMASLRTINVAAITYSGGYSNGFPPSIDALGGTEAGGPATCDRAQLIDPALAKGMKTGYAFVYLAQPVVFQARPSLSPEAMAKGCTVPGGTGYTVTAVPVTPGTTGARRFFTDETCIIRYETNGPATVNSPPLH
jgi:type IV pilus assembly protein PilA